MSRIRRWEKRRLHLVGGVTVGLDNVLEIASGIQGNRERSPFEGLKTSCDICLGRAGDRLSVDRQVEVSVEQQVIKFLIMSCRLVLECFREVSRAV